MTSTGTLLYPKLRNGGIENILFLLKTLENCGERTAMNIVSDFNHVMQAFGEEKALCMVKEAGFDGVDYPFPNPDVLSHLLDDDYLERAERTKKLLQKYGQIPSVVPPKPDLKA